jgi:hypothetical protein
LASSPPQEGCSCKFCHATGPSCLWRGLKSGPRPAPLRGPALVRHPVPSRRALQRIGRVCELRRNMARTPPDSLFPDYPAIPDYRFEQHAMQNGFPVVAGLDEAGRGPLAGPVVAAAVILDPECIPEGLDDSKALSKARRELLFEAILASSLVAVASASAREIEATDIRAASLAAMRRALCALPVKPHYALVDGRTYHPDLIARPGRWSRAMRARFPLPRPRSSPR